MLDALSVAFQAWREVLHVSEWTGLSVGALAGLAAIAWFFPPARTLAIGAGIAVAVAYGALLYGNHTGRDDVLAEWTAANAKAAADAKARDDAAAAAAEQKYAPIIADLQAQADARDQQVSDYESKIVGLSGACPLGEPPLRLRHRSK
jgi:hypothetical protein